MTDQNRLNVQPILLEGQWVHLEPLTLDYTEALLSVSQYEEIWQYFPSSLITRDKMCAWLSDTLAAQQAGTALPFVIVQRNPERVIGSTRYMNIVPHDRGLEIGGTWLTPDVWRTPINTECKYLLLQHAFEHLGCIRVQLKTDSRNQRSRTAIERLGAQFEGILRHHMIVRDGYYRDSAFYSIIDKEWPAVKARLTEKMSGT